jgi:regulatory protein
MLAIELRQKGVDDEVIEQALAETEDEQVLAHQSASKYARRLAGVDWEKFRKRLGDHLVRRGFSYGTIVPVLRQVWDEIHSAEGSDPTNNEDE